MLDLEGNPIIARTIVGPEHRDVGGSVRQRGAADVFIATILMHTLMALVMHIHAPILAEDMLHPKAGLQRIRRMVVRVNHCSLVFRRERSAEGLIDGLEC